MKSINKKLLSETNNSLKAILSEDIDDVKPDEHPYKGLSEEHEDWISEVWHEWAEDENWKVDAKAIAKDTIKEFEDAIESSNEREYQSKVDDGDSYAMQISFDGDKLIQKMAKEFSDNIGLYSQMKKQEQKSWWKGLFKTHGRGVFFSQVEETIEYEDHPSLSAWERNQ